MNEFIILTDSACDIEQALLKEWGVGYCEMTFAFSHEDRQYTNFELTPVEFYQRMRDGGIAKTSAINTDTFISFFEQYLKDGKDVIYLGFSSGLSSTYNCAQVAGEELSEKYPERKIVVVDTLCASAGFGLILYLAVKKKEQGANIIELADYVKNLVPSLCHWFTVDDLVYLKRGGRVSSAVALVGSVLGIKPVLHMDDEGHLISMSKVRGRKAAINALAEKYGELALKNDGSPIFISHGDCMDDALTLKKILGETYGVDVEIISDIGPVIGAHSGPGTLALFFIGKSR